MWRRPTINPYVILFPSTITLILIIVAYAWPVLIGVALAVTVVLATVSIFVGAAIIHGLREEHTALAERLRAANDRLGNLETKVRGYAFKVPTPVSINNTLPKSTWPRSAS